MSTSSRFAVAVHILTLLEMSEGEPVTSEYVAGSVNTHPAVVRRLLGMLAKAGITTSQLGAGGGALLAKAAADVTLLDVFRAVEEGDVFAMHHGRPSPACPVGRQIQGVLEVTTDAAQRALEEQLAARTVADILADVRVRESAECSSAA
ncbi:MAG: putative HTH-type transcriptional regulator ywnA [Gemmatimonadetes bacterium]|nr:putative HTH-type transcriptional regulator ywnA [Gemmatimonadota bacterium]